MPKTFYVTTAIDYTNAPPHIGHAYEKVLADVIARHRRTRPETRVFLLTGVDQHGQKVQQAAHNEGIEPGEFAHNIAQKFRALWQKLGVEPDGWASTTDSRHRRCVQSILQSLHDQADSDLYKATHRGFYSIRQEQFLTDKERSPEGEFGPEWGEVVELEEENWYFKLSRYRDWLLGFLASREDFIVPAFRRSELINAVEKLTGDLCISRPKSRLEWGIELPFDHNFVTYVWFDALINYVSFAGYRAEGDKTLPDFSQLWPADVHVIGKDIMVPAHGVYWPIMLHVLGFADEEIPPLLVHGWWNISGSKISKSAGNVIDPDALADQYGADAVRYYLMRDISTGQDADFNEERLRQRYNADLANDLGNLLNRSLNMAQRYRQGLLNAEADAGPLGAELRATAEASVRLYQEKMADYQIHAALEAVWSLISRANRFVEETAPWILAKDESQTALLDGVLYHLCESLRLAAVLISPVMPSASAKMSAQLQFHHALCSDDLSWGRLPHGHEIGQPEPLFPRLDG